MRVTRKSHSVEIQVDEDIVFTIRESANPSMKDERKCITITKINKNSFEHLSVIPYAGNQIMLV